MCVCTVLEETGAESGLPPRSAGRQWTNHGNSQAIVRRVKHRGGHIFTAKIWVRLDLGELHYMYVMWNKMGQAVEHSCSSLRLLEGAEPDPVRALWEKPVEPLTASHRVRKSTSSFSNTLCKGTLKMNRPQSAARMTCTLWRRLCKNHFLSVCTPNPQTPTHLQGACGGIEYKEFYITTQQRYISKSACLFVEMMQTH